MCTVDLKTTAATITLQQEIKKQTKYKIIKFFLLLRVI